MKISRERLSAEAQATGFRPDVLEKAIHLLNLIERSQEHPFLKGRLALKGGTALTYSSSTCRACRWTSTSTTSAPWNWKR